MADVTVAAERLPGIGWRYTVPADDGRQLLVVVEDSGPRHLVLVDAALDEPLTTVRFPAGHAAVLAALLTGARFTLAAGGEPATALGADAGAVAVEILEVAPGSPAAGLLPREVAPRLGPDAALLGVIDERTPELLESDAERVIRAGDRLVVAVRRGRLASLRVHI